MALKVYFYFHYTITDVHPILNNLSYKKTAEISKAVLNHFRRARYRDFDIEQIWFPGLGRGNLGAFPITQEHNCIIMRMHFEYPTNNINDEVVVATIRKCLPGIFEPVYFGNTEIGMGYFVEVQFTQVHVSKYEYSYY
jgi:hypothetical protein